MSMQEGFSCYLIGDRSLTQQCGEFILNRGHKISGLLTSDDELEMWAVRNKIPYFNSTEELVQFSQKNKIDYIFSIGNQRILSKDVLNIPIKFAINYHDGLLPKYAGTYPISWAILNQEVVHGITWHVMTEEIDAGDIILSQDFEIENDVTANGLDIKCAIYGIGTFEELLKQIETNTYVLKKQDLKERTYHKLSDKPKNYGFIDFSMTAEEIYRQYRGLTFGKFPNYLATFKLIINGKVYIPKKMTQTNERSILPPGRIVRYTQHELTVATTTTDIIFKNLYPVDVEGGTRETLHLDKVVFGVNRLDPVKSEPFFAKLKTVFPHEHFWVNALSTTNYFNLPFFKGYRDCALFHNNFISYNIPIKTGKTFKNNLYQEGIQTRDISISLILSYLAMLNDFQNISVGYVNKSIMDFQIPNIDFFSSFVPLSVEIEKQKNFIDVVKYMIAKRDAMKEKTVFLKDVYYRYPKLEIVNKFPPIIILDVDEQNADNPSFKKAIVFKVHSDRITIYVNKLFSNDFLAFVLKEMIENLKYAMVELEKNINLPVSKDLFIAKDKELTLIKKQNKTEKSFSQKNTFLNLFQTQAKKSPAHPALIFEKTEINYKDLEARSNQLAHFISVFINSKPKIVGLCFNRRPEMIINMLGVMKAGGIFLALNPLDPVFRLKFIIETAKCNLIITSEANKHLFREFSTDIQVVSYDTALPEINQNKAESLEKLPDENDIAYAIFTSGSTGNPKGVLIKQKSLNNLINFKHKMFNMTSFDRILNFSAFTFDAAIWEIFPTLAAGATLYLSAIEHVYPGRKLNRFLRKNKISILTSPPSVLSVTPESNLINLRLVISAGESCALSVAKRWSNGRRFINAYGPTEATVCVALHEYDERDEFISIGKPIDNVKVYVLDNEKTPRPIGVYGDLYVGGVGLAASYIGNEDLYHQNFIQNPFSEDKNEKIYKTNDIVRWLPNGELEYLKRTDDKVKIHGYLIDIREIENELQKSPYISQCVVVIHSDTNFIPYLVAYVIPSGKHKDISYEYVKKHLTKICPSYMVPSVSILDSFPINHHGKIDIKKLPLPNARKMLTGKTIVKPRTFIGERLADMVAELLGIDEFGLYDDFFELGGNSLLIGELIFNIKKIFKIEISISNFINNPTIANIESIITHQLNKQVNESPILNNDIKLYETIKVSNISKAKENFENVLLTGVTGHLGSYLLVDILSKTKAEVYCLIHQKSFEYVKNKLPDYLKKIIIKEEKRIHLLQGDISKPMFDLKREEYNYLVEHIDQIFHLGAKVNHVLGYEQLRKTNVLATLEIIKLASKGKPKVINYTSTLVVGLNDVDEKGFITEVFLNNQTLPQGLPHGYPETKWMSEILLTKAKNDGLIVKIFRACWLTSDSQGVFVEPMKNHLLLLLKSIIHYGISPTWDSRFNLLPVDFVSRMVLQLSLEIKGSNMFNIAPEKTVRWDFFMNCVENYGFTIKHLPPVKWYDAILSTPTTNNPLYPFLVLYMDPMKSSYVEMQNLFSEVRVDKLANFLKKTGQNFPNLDYQYVKNIFDYLVKVGFLSIVSHEQSAKENVENFFVETT